MPTYTYQCKKCLKTQDVFHGMSEKRRVKCAECGGPCRQLMGTGASLIFKGSGFYETDYKRSGSKAEAAAKNNGDGGKAESSKPDGGSGAKSESSGKSEPSKTSTSKPTSD